MKRNCLIILVSLFLTLSVRSQVAPITPQVINSAGGTASAGGGIEIDYSIGETVIATFSNNTITVTQGFLQPSRFGLTGLLFVTPVSCGDKTDGEIMVKPSVSGNTSSGDSLIYVWSSPGLCSSKKCSVVSNVPAGTYSVVVYHYNGGILKDSIIIKNIIVAGSTEPCQISIFNGLTPNGDGANDFFAIENIELFPGNRVSIYNRWGLNLFEQTDYDNHNSEKRWEGNMQNSANKAPSGTYFYIIDLNNSSKPIKGWVELTRR